MTRIDRAMLLADEKVALGKIVDALNNGLSPADNWYAKILGPITSPGTPNTEFTAVHNLGKTPIAYIVNVDRSAVVYDSRRSSWDKQNMFLKCSIASATIYLIVL